MAGLPNKHSPAPAATREMTPWGTRSRRTLGRSVGRIRGCITQYPRGLGLQPAEHYRVAVLQQGRFQYGPFPVQHSRQMTVAYRSLDEQRLERDLARLSSAKPHTWNLLPEHPRPGAAESVTRLYRDSSASTRPHDLEMKPERLGADSLRQPQTLASSQVRGVPSSPS